MWKICIKCKKHKALWEFYRHSKCSLGVASQCIQCTGEYYLDNKDRIRKYQDSYYQGHKHSCIERSSNYYYANIDKKREYQSNYWYKLPADIKKEKRDNYTSGNAKYNTFGYRLTVDESPKLANNGDMAVKCKFCNNYFVPTCRQVESRISALNDYSGRENNLYCSEECKMQCPVFNSTGNLPSTSLRESLPKDLRDEILQRNDGMCEMCGENLIEEIHHEKPVATHPHLQLDKDNLWGVCIFCHYKIFHQLEGCTLPELRKKSINNCNIKD